MYVELSAECTEDDPVLVVPWTVQPTDLPADQIRSTLGPAFVDLREDPYALDQIPEADQHPALLQALRALNAPRSPVFTAKCDAWTMSGEELAAVQFDLMIDPQDAPHGFASYIDLLWRERVPFASFHSTEQLVMRLLRMAEPLDHPQATLSCVVRPALLDLAGPREGFAVSLYLRAVGTSPAESYRLWGAALGSVVQVLRGRELRGREPLRSRTEQA